MTLTVNSRFLDKKKEGYVVSALIVNEDLVVELNAPLIVIGDMFIAGRLLSSVDIEVGKTFVCVGQVESRTLDIKGEAVFKGKANINGSLRTGKKLIAQNIDVSKNIVSNDSIYITGRENSVKSMVANSFLMVCGNLTVKDKIGAGTGIDIRGQLKCEGRMKVSGIEVFEYGRVSFGNIAFNLYGNNMILLHLAGKPTKLIVNYNNMLEKDGYKKEEIEAVDSARDILAFVPLPFK